jgi:peptide/nickel transport system substrate-binding protein
MIESKGRWDAVGATGYGEAIVGTGPFRFDERVEGVHVRYEAIDDHWRVSPDYRELEFRWVPEAATRLATLMTNEVHMSDVERAARPEAVAKGMKILPSSFAAVQFRVYFGGQYYTEPEQMQTGEPFHNKKVRQAMNKAINRQAIVDSFLPGSDVLLPYFHPFHPVLDEAVWPGITNAQWLEQYDEMYGYDPVRARALLVEAGYPEGFEFTHYLFTLPGLPEMVEIGQAMALDWEAIGLKPKMENLEFSAVRKKYRSYNMHDAMWGIRSATTAHYAMIGFNTTSTTTHYYQVPELDAKMAELDRTIQNEERARLLREMGDILYFDFAMIQMFSLSSEIMVDPTAVAGYKFPGLMSGFYTHLEYIETVPQ